MDGPFQATGLSGNPGLERVSLQKKTNSPQCNYFLKGKKDFSEFHLTRTNKSKNIKAKCPESFKSISGEFEFGC